MSRHLVPLVAAGLLLVLAPAAAAQLDPVASKQAAKELKIVAKGAAYEHRVQLVDGYINFAYGAAFALAHAQMGGFYADNVDQLGDALNGLMVDVEAGAHNMSSMVAAQIPYALQKGFAGAQLWGQLPLGFRPGDDGVLDDFRAKLAKQQHVIIKAAMKGVHNAAKLVFKKSSVHLDLELAEPEVPWIAGDQQAYSVGAARHLTLDVILVVSDSSSDIGRRILLAGSAVDSDGDIVVTLLGPDGVIQKGTSATPLDGRWRATLTDVACNPAVVRIGRDGATLIERAVGVP